MKGVGVFKQYKGKMFCFSPPVMLATFIVEISLAIYTLWRYKMSKSVRLAILLLIFLAVFQLAEYMVCGGWGINSMDWARIGYVAITALPPLGVHLAFSLAGKRNTPVVASAYAVGALFMMYFLFATDVFTGSQCLGNYVIFQMGSFASQLYWVYYYALLLLTMGVSFRLAMQVPKRKRALEAFVAGYVLFMLPTTIANTINPETIKGVPSIMCGFAVLLALVLVFWVLPATERRKKR